MTENFYETWRPLVERTTKYVARDFPDVEAADLSQDLYAFILKAGWTDPTDESVVTVIRRATNALAMHYRTQQLGQSAQYSYRTSEIKEILWKMFDHNDWPMRSIPTAPAQNSGEQIPQWGLVTDQMLINQGFEPQHGEFNKLPKASTDFDLMSNNITKLVGAISRPNLDFDDQVCAFADVKQAWQYLPKQYKIAILKRYGFGWEHENSNERRRCERAVIRLTDILNWYRGRNG